MSPGQEVGVGVASLHFYLATAARCDHEMSVTLGAIDQTECAALASQADDAWVYYLESNPGDAL